MSSVAPTFLAALRAVGTASTMAFAGFYLDRRGFVTPSGKKMMALLSQQVTIPAFLFAKIIYCPSGGGGDGDSGAGSGMEEIVLNYTDRSLEEFSELDLNFTGTSLLDSFAGFQQTLHQSHTTNAEIICPSVADRISDLWMLLIWPFYVVAAGLITGYVAAKISKTPPVQTRSCLAACAFGNSTGLVLTLLTVIHGQFAKSSELGRIDPTAFLSVYLLLYPVLQWGVGGWLLAPDEKTDSEKDADKMELGISMVDQNGRNDFPSSVIISNRDVPLDIPTTEEHSLLANHSAQSQTATEQQRSLHKESIQNNYIPQRPFYISHLLNHDSLISFSPAVEAGEEEFGGVPQRRLLISSSTPNGENGRQHRRFFTTGRIDSSNSVFATMVRELSSSSVNKLMNSGSGSENGHEEVASYSSPLLTQRSSFNQNIDIINSHHGSGDDFFLQQNAETDEGPVTIDDRVDATPAQISSTASMTKSSSSTSTNSANKDFIPPTIHEHAPLLAASGHSYSACDGLNLENNNSVLPPSFPKKIQSDLIPLTSTLIRIARKVFQPPVIGALAGLFIASFPNVRGLLVNIWGNANVDGNGVEKTAPLEWMFDGIHSVGEAAVPINMTILGINLSSTFQKNKPHKTNNDDGNAKSKLLSNETMLAVVIGKMIVMPAIGIVSTWILQRYYIVLPDEIDATCYLVMMIVFITPTANNVMIMVELSGSSSKEGMARLIGWQYVVSPVLLSIVLSVVVSLASGHFDASPM